MKKLISYCSAGKIKAAFLYEVILINKRVFTLLYDDSKDSCLITNDLSSAIDELKKIFTGIYRSVIFYIDKQGCWDQIKYYDGEIKYISLKGAMSFEEAFIEWKGNNNNIKLF